MGRPPTPIGSHGAIATTALAARRHVARTRYRDRDGITRKVEASGASAAAARRNLIAALASRQTPGGSEITGATRVALVVERWLADVEGSERAHSTKKLYRDVARGHVVPAVGALRVREARVAALEAVLAELVAARGPAVGKIARTVLTGSLAIAVRHGAIETNPVRELSPVRQARREVRALDVEQVRALRTDLAADARALAVDLPALLDLMLGTGARIGEALALRWADVDLPGATVSLTGTVVRLSPAGGAPGALIRQDTTKGHRPRALLVPTFTLAALAGQRERHPGADLVFPSAAGGLREVATVQRQWRVWRQRHPAWTTVTFHDARRAVATVIDRGAGIDAAAAQLGHASSRVTAERYVARAPVAADRTGLLDAFADVLAGFAPDRPSGGPSSEA